jgi:hypothetical protein
MVFGVEYRVVAWLLAKAVVWLMVFLRNSLPLRSWTLRLSSLFLPFFLFLRQVVVAMLTGVFFLCQVVLHPCCRLILFLIHVCRVDSAAFRVVVPADSVLGFVGRRHRPVAANEV